MEVLTYVTIISVACFCLKPSATLAEDDTCTSTPSRNGEGIKEQIEMNLGINQRHLESRKLNLNINIVVQRVVLLVVGTSICVYIFLFGVPGPCLSSSLFLNLPHVLIQYPSLSISSIHKRNIESRFESILRTAPNVSNASVTMSPSNNSAEVAHTSTDDDIEILPSHKSFRKRQIHNFSNLVTSTKSQGKIGALFPLSNFNLTLSTEQNYKSVTMEFHGRYASIRTTLDHLYHSNYITERQQLQDSIITSFLNKTTILDSYGNTCQKPLNPWIVFTAG